MRVDKYRNLFFHINFLVETYLNKVGTMKRKDHVYIVSGSLKTENALVKAILDKAGILILILCKEWRNETAIEVKISANVKLSSYLLLKETTSILQPHTWIYNICVKNRERS